MQKMVKTLVMITGPMGVGKTTSGKLLSDKLGRTAFIDGDWCMDIHPFVGNKETIDMAINNILFMINNYVRCSECDHIVLSWVMSEKTIDKISNALKDVDVNIHKVTLTCNKDALLDRWCKDTTTEWRTDEWLQESMKSLQDYGSRKDTIIIDTSALSLNDVADVLKNRLFLPL